MNNYRDYSIPARSWKIGRAWIAMINIACEEIFQFNNAKNKS